MSCMAATQLIPPDRLHVFIAWMVMVVVMMVVVVVMMVMMVVVMVMVMP